MSRKTYSEIRKEKKLAKSRWQESQGVLVDADACILLSLFDLKDNMPHTDTFLSAIPGLCTLGFTVIVRACGSKKSQERIHALLEEFPDMLILISDDNETIDSYIQCADAVYIPKEDTQFLERARKGYCAVLAPDSLGQSFSPLSEEGDTIHLTGSTSFHVLDACIRMRETMRFPYDWKILLTNSFEKVQ